MHVVKARNTRPTVRNPEQPAGATGRMQAQKLIELIDETVQDEGVVDVHQLESSFANGSRRIALVDPEETAVVGAIVDGAADSTRRMSAVEWQTAVSAVVSEVHSESTMRMSAIQASELAALTSDVEVEVTQQAPVTASHLAASASEPVVRFSAPRLVLPIPAPVEDDEIADEYRVEPAQTAVQAPAKRRVNAWMIGALIAFAGAATGLVIVALERI